MNELTWPFLLPFAAIFTPIAVIFVLAIVGAVRTRPCSIPPPLVEPAPDNEGSPIYGYQPRLDPNRERLPPPRVISAIIPTNSVPLQGESVIAPPSWQS